MSHPDQNIARALAQLAGSDSESPAVVVPSRNQTLTFAELEADSNRIASGLAAAGLGRGDRVLVLVPFGLDFVSTAFGLFKAGAIPVLIDPGMGRTHLLQCVLESQPKGMIAIARAHMARWIFSRFFRTVQVRITAGSRWFLGGSSLDAIRRAGDPGFVPAQVGADTPAAILFTSGSTGPPKGVLYTHGAFCRQVEILRDVFGVQKGEVDLPTFPLFGLFSVGLGMTAVIPDMDFTRPAQVNPERIVRTVRQYRVTNSFGSPALWDTVSRHCREQGETLPSLRRILMAGAPVPGSLLERFESIVDRECRIHTPYGATEALPVASIERKEILGETWERSRTGQGICVGKAVRGMEVSIIPLSDPPIDQWDDSLAMKPGEVGEIVVKGPWVTREYFNRDEANRLAKIKDGDTVRHRMGDVGRIDDLGRIWFYGRKSQRVLTAQGPRFTLPCEAIFNRHPEVKRSALVGLGQPGNQEPVIVIELRNRGILTSAKEKSRLTRELLALGGQFPHTAMIARVLFHPSFPVDVRHNAKIFRERLAEWAGEQSSTGPT
ncbi:MAG: AMP-dependent synthetase [Nitrospinae bacterium CG11_big_fil_rev_8_21_14_0_20_56_8]|nr:MAG: AMP-dependent synthetase [Nitrospinae bacterium CG11_big_fil_rev_8_21_14_0_20_56_8]